MLMLMCALSFLATADSMVVPSFNAPKIEAIGLTAFSSDQPSVQLPPVRQAFQYPVGFIRRHWRTDVPLTTLVHGRDTLCTRVTNAELEEVKARTILPDTAIINMEVSIIRFTQDRHGRVIGRPRDLGVVPDALLMLLEAKDVRWGQLAPPPPTLPRRWPAPAITSSSAGMHRHPQTGDGLVIGKTDQGNIVQVDWPRYTAVLYGDTLTRGLFATDQERAMIQLGYSESDTYDLYVTIERYTINLGDNRIISGPRFIGPMTKQSFDRRSAQYTTSTAEIPMSMTIYEQFPAP